VQEGVHNGTTYTAAYAHQSDCLIRPEGEGERAEGGILATTRPLAVGLVMVGLTALVPAGRAALAAGMTSVPGLSLRGLVSRPTRVDRAASCIHGCVDALRLYQQNCQ
jgi:hypothetical protein